MADATIFNVTIEAGEELVRALDSLGLPPETAAWFYDMDREEWRLLLQFDASHESYPTLLEIARLIGARDDIANALSMDDITVVAPDDDLALAVRAAVQTGSDVTQRPFGPSYTNGTYIKRGLAYRSYAPRTEPAPH